MSRFCNFTIFAIFCWVPALCRATFDDDHHECARPCSNERSSKKTCVYNFSVTETYDASSFCNESEDKDEIVACVNHTEARNRLAINGKTPGPAIQVCLGDTIEVVVYNKLRSEELAVHWHGIRQKGLNHMDGVPMITQCPILPFSGFRYKIIPGSAGTYFYRAHSVSQQGGGVYGSLTVRGPRDDPSLERILVLSSRPPTPRQSSLYPPTPDELLVNGQTRESTLRVRHGLSYLLRLVNANAHDCPVLLSLHGHSLRVSAADGNPVQSMAGTHVVLFPGERLDGVLTTDQAVGKYAIDIQGLRDCRGVRHEMYILYEDATVDSYILRTTKSFCEQELKIAESGHHCYRIAKDVICSLDLKSTKISQLQEEPDQTIYVPFDTNSFSFTDDMTEFDYDIYKLRYYPAYLSLEKGVTKIPQINGMSFKYPSSPILSQPEETSEKTICTLDERSKDCVDTPLFCECLQLLPVPPQKTVEVVLIDEGFGGNVSHTFHLHGYNASVISRESFEHPITKDYIVSLDHDGKIYRNLVNPVQKDTFVVPNKGYIILRFYTDNLGYWLWEARSTATYPQFGSGMQFLMRVGLHLNLPPIPINFPSCGNNLGKTVLFETI